MGGKQHCSCDADNQLVTGRARLLMSDGTVAMIVLLGFGLLATGAYILSDEDRSRRLQELAELLQSGRPPQPLPVSDPFLSEVTVAVAALEVTTTDPLLLAAQEVAEPPELEIPAPAKPNKKVLAAAPEKLARPKVRHALESQSDAAKPKLSDQDPGPRHAEASGTDWKPFIFLPRDEAKPFIALGAGGTIQDDGSSPVFAIPGQSLSTTPHTVPKDMTPGEEGNCRFANLCAR